MTSAHGLEDVPHECASIESIKAKLDGGSIENYDTHVEWGKLALHSPHFLCELEARLVTAIRYPEKHSKCLFDDILPFLETISDPKIVHEHLDLLEVLASAIRNIALPNTRRCMDSFKSVSRIWECVFYSTKQFLSSLAKDQVQNYQKPILMLYKLCGRDFQQFLNACIAQNTPEASRLVFNMAIDSIASKPLDFIIVKLTWKCLAELEPSKLPLSLSSELVAMFRSIVDRSINVSERQVQSKLFVFLGNQVLLMLSKLSSLNPEGFQSLHISLLLFSESLIILDASMAFIVKPFRQKCTDLFSQMRQPVSTVLQSFDQDSLFPHLAVRLISKFPHILKSLGKENVMLKILELSMLEPNQYISFLISSADAFFEAKSDSQLELQTFFFSFLFHPLEIYGQLGTDIW